VRIWDAATGRDALTLKRGMRTGVADIAFSPDGQSLASVGADQTGENCGTCFAGQEALTLRGHLSYVRGGRL